ncbi:MAG: nuclear transport factor 2 family protein [Solirubrobacterales bacterium]
MKGGTAEWTRAGYEAFNAGDVPTLVAMLTLDFEWHEAAEIPGPKSAISRDEFVRFMRGFDMLWDEFAFEPLEIVEGDGAIYAKVRARGRGKASEELVEFEIHHVWRVRDGLFDRMDAYLEEADARGAAGVEVPAE